MQEYKNINIRLPKEIWKYLKVESMEKDTSMVRIILDSLEKQINLKKKKTK